MFLSVVVCLLRADVVVFVCSEISALSPIHVPARGCECYIAW